MLNNTKTSLKGGNKETLDFPLIIEPENSVDILSEWIVSNRLNFEKSKETYGAILFRGFEVDSVDKFENFTKNFVDIPLEYNLRSSPRYSVGKNVYHTTTYPSQYSINMHSESSYAPIHPSNIVFCCINPADERGETPIADNRLVLKNLSESTKMKFLERGVKYVRNLNSEFGLSWEEVFQTSSKDKVEEDCRREGIQFLWKGDQRLELNWCKNAIWEHPVTNEKVWFNHAFFFNKYSSSKLKRKLISLFGLLQFSVENAYNVKNLILFLVVSLIIFSIVLSPALCPRFLDFFLRKPQRPFPSIIMATCFIGFILSLFLFL